MIDDNQKRFIPHLPIDNNFFHSAFVNPVRAVCVFTAHLPIEGIMGNYVRDGAIALKGSHLMGDELIFLKSLRDTSFNKDLSNEPTFGQIHLAGQYL
jgi:hypothetical protein